MCAATKRKGNINTPMELAINNQTDRFSLAIDAIDRIPKLQRVGAMLKRNSAIADCMPAPCLRVRDRQPGDLRLEVALRQE